MEPFAIQRRRWSWGGGLGSLGIVFGELAQKPRTDPDTLESDRSGVYLAGVIVAGMHTNEIFVENGRFHGGQIAADIAAKLGGRC